MMIGAERKYLGCIGFVHAHTNHPEIVVMIIKMVTVIILKMMMLITLLLTLIARRTMMTNGKNLPAAAQMFTPTPSHPSRKALAKVIIGIIIIVVAMVIIGIIIVVAVKVIIDRDSDDSD